MIMKKLLLLIKLFGIRTLIIAVYLSLYSMAFYGTYTFVLGEHAVIISSVFADSIRTFNFDNFGGSHREYSTHPSVEGEINHEQSQYINVELTIDDVRKQRLLLLDGINDTIKRLPDSSFKQIALSEEQRNSLISDVSNIATLLQSDKLDAAIAKLTDLKIKVMRIALPNSNNLVFLIDNLSGSLEKQK
jgi:hypothetical protein